LGPQGLKPNANQSINQPSSDLNLRTAMNIYNCKDKRHFTIYKKMIQSKTLLNWNYEFSNNLELSGDAGIPV